MSFVRPQRPVVPPAPNAGNYWGLYDVAADLPNTPGSEFNLPDLQDGDLAWVDGDTLLYFCADSTLGAAVWTALSAAGPPVFPDGFSLVLTNSLNASDNINITRTFVGGGDGVEISMGPGGQAVTGHGVNASMGSGSTGHGLRVILAAGATGDGLHVEDSGSGPAIFADKIGGVGDLIDLQIGGVTAFAIDAVGSLSAAADAPSLEAALDLDATAGVSIRATSSGVATAGDVDILSDSTAAGATSGNVIIGSISSGAGTEGGVVLVSGGITAPAASAGEITVRASTTIEMTVTGGGTSILIGDATSCARIFHAEVAGSAGNACVQLNATGAPTAGAFGIGQQGGFANFTPTDDSVAGALAGIDTALGSAGADTLQSAYVAGNTIAITAANGSVSISNPTDGTDLLTLSQTFAGAGDAIDVTMGALTAGDGVHVTMVTGATGDAWSMDDGTVTTTINITDVLVDQATSFDFAANTTGTNTAGTDFTITGGQGGPSGGGGPPGGSGGDFMVTGGAGGTGAAGGAGGIGGLISLTAGAGAAGVDSGGGVGGGVIISGGAGGAAGTSSAGSGGSFAGIGGVGGAATAAVVAEDGGASGVTGGVGGAGSATGAAGVGGIINVTGGAGGADGGGGGAAGGAVFISGGAGVAAADGAVNIGTVTTASIASGSGTTVWTHTGRMNINRAGGLNNVLVVNGTSGSRVSIDTDTGSMDYRTEAGALTVSTTGQPAATGGDLTVQALGNGGTSTTGDLFVGVVDANATLGSLILATGTSFPTGGAGEIVINAGGTLDIDANGVMTLDATTNIQIAPVAGDVGFFGATPVGQSAAYTRNAAVVEDRTLLASASATTLNNNNVLAALIADLQAIGILG